MALVVACRYTGKYCDRIRSFSFVHGPTSLGITLLLHARSRAHSRSLLVKPTRRNWHYFRNTPGDRAPPGTRPPQVDPRQLLTFGGRLVRVLRRVEDVLVGEAGYGPAQHAERVPAEVRPLVRHQRRAEDAAQVERGPGQRERHEERGAHDQPERQRAERQVAAPADDERAYVRHDQHEREDALEEGPRPAGHLVRKRQRGC